MHKKPLVLGSCLSSLSLGDLTVTVTELYYTIPYHTRHTTLYYTILVLYYTIQVLYYSSPFPCPYIRKFVRTEAA